MHYLQAANQPMKLTAHRVAEPDGALGLTWSWD